MRKKHWISIGRRGFTIFPLVAFAARVDAGSPWDGLWDLDAAASRFSAHTIVLTQLPNGMWRYGDGPAASAFAVDGKPYPEPNAPDFMMTARITGTSVLELIESCYGRDTQKERWQVSEVGSALNITSTRVYPDGRETTTRSSAVRVRGKSGFAGVWKVAPEDKPDALATAPNQNGKPENRPRDRPYWVISTAPDGVMTWFIPATGELIRGKPDGAPRPITGPQQPSRRTFIWQTISTRQIEFYASDNGHLVERATETLSADGQTLTDQLWLIGHEEEEGHPDIPQTVSCQTGTNCQSSPDPDSRGSSHSS